MGEPELRTPPPQHNPDRPPSKSNLAAVAVSVLLLAAVTVGSLALFHTLNGIEQSGEMWLKHGKLITGGSVTACFVAAAIGALGWNVERQLVARALRFAAIAAAIGLVCTGCPVPGGLVSALVLLIAAGRLAVVVASPLVCLVRPRFEPPSLGLLGLAALTALMAASAALLSVKRDGLGWAHGVD